MLKEKNRTRLGIFAFVHVGLIVGPYSAKFINVDETWYSVGLWSVGSVGVISLLAFVVEWVVDSIPRSLKHRLISRTNFATEAFSRWANSDTRIRVETLKARYRPWPIVPEEQEALWYRLSKARGEAPAVKEKHRQWLMARDAVSIAVFGLAGQTLSMLAIFLLSWNFQCFALCASVTVLVFLATRLSARNFGGKFVAEVLVDESHAPNPGVTDYGSEPRPSWLEP